MDLCLGITPARAQTIWHFGDCTQVSYMEGNLPPTLSYRSVPHILFLFTLFLFTAAMKMPETSTRGSQDGEHAALSQI